MQAIFLRIRTWWETADRTQKTVTIFGGAFFLLLLFGTFYFTSKPKMEVLFRGLSPQDQGMVANELTKMGVPFDEDRAGNVMVPTDKVAEVQGKLAVSQKMPSSGHPGYADLKDFGIMNTPSVERERLKKALEDELSMSIEGIDGVKSARVHLTLKNDSPFAREEDSATASVIVTESGDGALGGEEARAIQHLVQYAVSGLTEKNITVVSSTGKTLIDSSDAGGGSGVVAERLGTEISESRRREAMLQASLDTAFGKGNTVVRIPIFEMMFDQKEERRDDESPNKPLAIEKTTETMANGGGAGAGGPAGAASNLPGGAPATTTGSGSDGTYTGTSESKTYGTTQVQSNTVFAPGTIKRMAINVLVNKAKVTDPTAVEQVIKGELGPLATDSTNFSYAVTPIEFDTTATAAADKADKEAASSARMQQILSILPIAALILVGFLVVKAIGKVSKEGNTLVAALPGGGMMPLGPGEMETKLLVDEGGVPTTVALDSEKAIEAVQQGKVLGTVQTPIARHPEMGLVGESHHGKEHQGDLVEFVGPESALRIAKIPDQVNIPLEQIRRMALDRPDNVAMLLKTWLLSDPK
ncbi:MAG: flagellar M-ring protein FliF [Armatimonadetes bacterium]|nr:flagellar M-ring protein FliF [Armatimonadota bacterium]